MGKKISQYQELSDLTTVASFPVIDVKDGVLSNFRFRIYNLKNILGLIKDDVGLANVDNTADIDKPISTAVGSALTNKADKIHVHLVSEITGLEAALIEKADVSHNHAMSDVTGLEAKLVELEELIASISISEHSHNMTDVIGLYQALSEKADLDHLHSITQVSGLPELLDSKAPNEHQHTIGDVTGLTEALEDKASDAELTAALALKSDVGHRHTADDIDGGVASTCQFVNGEW